MMTTERTAAELRRLAAEAESDVEMYRLEVVSAREKVAKWRAHESLAQDRAAILRRAAERIERGEV